MNSQTEQEKYLKAKFDLLQAEKSFYELPQELRNQLIIEMCGSGLIVKLAEILKEMG